VNRRGEQVLAGHGGGLKVCVHGGKPQKWWCMLLALCLLPGRGMSGVRVHVVLYMNTYPDLTPC
jgi:hypothetical protein